MSKGRRHGERRARRGGGAVEQISWRQVANPFPPLEAVSADELEAIHRASLRVLEEIGVDFLLPEARDMLERAGADVAADGPRVRFDRAFIREAVARAPSTFAVHARNPARDLVFGGNAVNFAVVASAPNVSDLDRGRRPGNFEDYCNLVRLGQALNIAHLNAGYPVEPTDLPPPTRHLDAFLAQIRLSDKVYSGYALGRERMVDFIEMARMARGVDEARFEREPSLCTVVNANSPLQYDRPMLEGLIEMARRNQVVVITPFTLAGAMAPVTVVGALVQQNAEALAGIAFAQVVRPGAPVMYGGFTSNVDMRTGSPAFGTPEYAKATLVGGQLARRVGVPFRASNATSANAPDGQAVYESEMSVWASVMAHASLVKHGLGWLQGGLCASYEKLVLDAEMLQAMAEFLTPLTVDDDALAVEAIAEVGPGGHFFSSSHTLARYERAFYAPLVSDWRNFETWSADGAVGATQWANRIWKRLLAEYEAPPLDPAIDEALADFVARRKAEGGIAAA